MPDSILSLIALIVNCITLLVLYLSWHKSRIIYGIQTYCIGHEGGDSFENLNNQLQTGQYEMLHASMDHLDGKKRWLFVTGKTKNNTSSNSSQKWLYLFSGILIGAWPTLLFIKNDFNSTIIGLMEAGNTNWDNLRVEMIDTMGLLTLGLSVLSIVYIIDVGITLLRATKK
ncbi:MAG: hypothetical protein WC777_00220 [Candidatus Gracilibacteria bacterium]|jgi:hypothetical protein